MKRPVKSSKHSPRLVTRLAAPLRNPEDEDEDEGGKKAKCDNCSKMVDEGGLEQIEDQKWCEDCAGDAVWCEHEDAKRLGKGVEVLVKRAGWRSKERTETWCESCAGDSDAVRCESGYGCGRYVVSELAREVDDEQWCPDCCENNASYCEHCEHHTASGLDEVRVGDADNYATEYWCESCRDDDGVYCDRCEATYSDEHDHRAKVINDAHDGEQDYEPIHSPWVHEQPKPLWFGVELEVMSPGFNKERDEYAQQVIDSIGPKYGDVLLYDIQEDTSLDEDSFEIITQPAGLDVHREQWLKADLHDLRGDDLSGYGMHIHFTRSAMKKVDGKYPAVGRMSVFLSSEANSKFVETVARRSYNDWARQAEDARIAEAAGWRTDKFSVLNTLPSRTFEFRLPRSSVKPTTIIATVEFIYMLIRFCEQASNRELDVPHFLSFVAESRWAKETIFLRAYLVDRGLATAKQMNIPKPKPASSGGVRSNPGRDEDYYARWAVREYRRTKRVKP